MRIAFSRLLILGLVFNVSVLIAAVQDGEIDSDIDSTRHEYSPLVGAIDLQYLPISYREFDWLNRVQNTKSGHGIKLGWEFLPLGQFYGKPGIGVSVGFNWIEKAELETGALAYLYTLPINPYLSYRFDYIQNQVLVPYGKFGIDFTLLQQRTVDETGSRLTSRKTFGLNYALGIEFCLNVIDRRSGADLDSTIGINGTYVTFEYQKSNKLGSELQNSDLSHDAYILGMRFEL